MNTLKAEKRSMDIKAKKLRREGFVTGNVFGREMEESVPVKMEKKDVESLLKISNKGSQIMLDIDGTKKNVLIKDVQFDPVKKQFNEIDFQALVSDEAVHSVAEIVLVDAEKVTTGVLEEHLEEVAFKALPKDLVDKIEVNVGDMHAGDTIRVKDLAIAKNPEVTLSTDPEALVVSVTEVYATADADEEAEGETAAATEE
ncbi:MAG: 50S ribosomal protein L25 [Lachnospiraceae bacterium]|nr:50S ribosomal protein L25 [Lachnospiraceae bacterium]